MRELPEYPGDIDPSTQDVSELQRLVSIRETQLSEYVVRADDLQSQVDQLREAHQQAESARAAAEAHAGLLNERVQAQDQALGELGAARDQLQTEIGQVRADYDARLQTTLREALEQARQGFAQEKAVLAEERDRLRAQLEAAGDETDQRSADPQSIADSFAAALDEVAARPAVEGRSYVVNVARMEVEARGVLQAPEAAGKPPEFVTVAPGAVDPRQLSTIRMEFRVSPRTPGEAES